MTNAALHALADYDPRRGTFIGRDGYERPCP